MKFSVFTDQLGCDSFDEALEAARELGFDTVDLRAGLDGASIDTLTPEQALSVKQKLDNHGLTCRIISSWAINPCAFDGPPGYDNNDENHHIRTLKKFDSLCGIADILGAKAIRIYSLARPEGFDALPDSDREAAYRHNATVLVRIANLAQQRNKVAVVENEPPTLTRSAKELGKLMKYANHPHLKVNWDLMNEWRAGNCPTVNDYEAIKGHVYQTHLKGARKKIGTERTDQPFGERLVVTLRS